MLKIRPYFFNRRILSPIRHIRYKLFGPGPRYGYMCKTDFDYELGEAMYGTKIYPSEEDLRRNYSCVEECGIVKVKVIFQKTIQKSTF